MSETQAQIEPPFAFGQTVYKVYASAHARESTICPICFGKRIVTLILGDGSQQEVACDDCGRGCDGPTGEVYRWGPVSSVRECIVTGMKQYDGTWEIALGNDHARLNENLVFVTHEEAEARRAELHAKCERDAEDAWGARRQMLGKSVPWRVSYHRREIKDAERRIAWHSRQLHEDQAKIDKRVAAAKAREETR
jgi:hypothetical protein